MSLFRSDAHAQALDAALRGDYSGRPIPKPRYGATTTRGFTECQRLFFWQYVVGLSAPSSPAQQLGTDVHAVQERYLRTGEPPAGRTKAEQIALPGLRHLPAPRTPGMHVEDSFSVPWALPGGRQVEVTGQIDLWLEGSPIKLKDHKTTGDIKWIKSKHELATDVQANLYAAILLARLPSADAVELEWLYYVKKTPHACLPVRVDRSRAEVEDFIGRVVDPALDGMLRLVEDKPRLTEVKPSPSHCDSYGGCYARALCWSKEVTTGDQLVTIGAKSPLKEESDMGIVAKQVTPQVQSAPQRVSKEAILARAQSLAAKYAHTDVNPPAVQLVPAESAPAEAQEQAPEKPKRGRPKGAGATIAKLAEETEKAFAAPPAQESAKPGSKRAPGYHPEHRYWLLLGCVATKGVPEVVDADSLVGSAQADAADANKLEHYRKGGGYALLEWAMAKRMEETPLTGVVRVAAPLSPAARDVVGLLRAHAQLIVEGGAL